MIKATFDCDLGKGIMRMHLKGHANTAEYGHDLICASASILAYTLAQVAKDAGDMLVCKPTVKLHRGDATVICRAKTDCIATILNSYATIERGFAVLAHNYPEAVKVKRFNIIGIKTE